LALAGQIDKIMKSRIDKDKSIVEDMIKIYCKGNRHSENKNMLCHDCSELLNYAIKKLDKCPFENEKMFCSKCKVHCYDTNEREQIKGVMRYSGPRMIFYHPVTTMRHILSK